MEPRSAPPARVEDAPPARPGAELAALPRGGRGLLSTGAGAVLCELVPLGIDASGARYELRITNGTPGALAATATAVRADARRPVAALAVAIEPHAAIRTGFALDPKLAYERVAAEVHGDGVHLLVEAPPPRGGRPRRPWVPAAFAIGGAALLAGATIGVYAAERPRIVEAALVGIPGGGVEARWATAGTGKRSYELRDAAGDVIAAGSLPSAAGELPVGGPAASLRVAIANAFGSDARDAAFARATPPPAIRVVATPPPRIVSLAVEPPQPNQPLTVRYRAARAKDVRLAIVDRDGKPWFSTTAPGGEGVTRVPAPPAGAGEPYALVATADGASAGESTRVPLPAAIVPGPSAAPAAAPSGAPVAAAPAGGPAMVDAGGGDDFAISPSPVKAGQPFVVEVPFTDGARVVVVRDRDGAELAAATLRPGQRGAALVAPPLGATYTVRVTLQRGEGDETLIEPLRETR